jgi:uncharacterized protein DUF5343
MRKDARTGPLDAPPCISYKTFSGFIDRLHHRGKPHRIDRSFLAFLSGSNQTQLLAALRYFDLISENGMGTEKLDLLVKSVGAEYESSLRDALKRSYPFLFNRFDLRRATLQELEGKFSAAGASSDTLRKSIAFFLRAAKAADIPTSPFISGFRRRRRSTSQVADRARKPMMGEPCAKPATQDVDRSERTGDSAELLAAKFPQFDPRWPDEIKATWFKAFHKLIEKLEI